MIAVVTAMGGEIEGNRQALLPGGEIAPVEGVGILRGGESGILPDGPGLRRVHRRIRPAQKRRLAGIGVEKVEPGEIGFAINRPHLNGLRRHPRRGRVLGGRNRRLGESNVGEVGDLTHLTPRISCAACKVETALQPMNMKAFTPAWRSSASRSPGRPAKATVAPAAVSALAMETACVS